MKKFLGGIVEHAVLVLAVICAVGLAVKLHLAERDGQAAVAAAYKTERALNDSTRVQLANAQAANRQLAALYGAATAMHGKLVAGVAIKVAKRDTVLIHDTLPTITTMDSTRTAGFQDSTFAGTITGVVEAPPFPSPIGVTYHVVQPAFRPEVGFVKVDGNYVAVVEWQGQRYTIDSPTWTPDAAAAPAGKRFVVYGDVLTDPALTITTRFGASLKVPWSLRLLGEVSQRWKVGDRALVNVGLHREW